MTNRHVQKFPSGEVRVFEGEEGKPMVLVEHTRAEGDELAGPSLLGTKIEDMPPPFEPKPEAVNE